MAGFFGLFDYNKEGPGVYLNEPPKGPFKTFFAILGRKFWKIVTINMMYIVFSIPVLIVAWMAGSQIFPALAPALNLETFEKLFSSGISSSAADTSAALSSAAASLSQAVSGAVSGISSGAASGAAALSPKESAAVLFSQIILVLSFALIGLQLFVFGPVHAGITYLFRNYAREEHAFIWGDFKEHLSKNWKQSSVTSLISFLAVILISVNFSFYSDAKVISNVFVKGALSGAIVILALIFTIMQMYIYPMLVTFKLTIRQLYKNSALLAMARLPFNVGIVLISLIITLVLPLVFMFIGGVGIVLSIFYYFFVAFGLNLMVTNFFVYRQLKRYMIDPMKSGGDSAGNAAAGPEEEPIFSDTVPGESDGKDRD